MGFTDSFKRQHSEILENATKISNLLETETIIHHADEAINLLTALSGKLSAHLTMEDNVLYPKLYEHKHEDVRNTAKEFFDEMGGLTDVFEKYCNKWIDINAIKKQPDDFITETQGLFDALAKRIEREDNILYPMADQ